MFKRYLLPMILAAVAVFLAHGAAAGTCGMAGVVIATQAAPKGDCVCEDGRCLSATAAACATCLVSVAIGPPGAPHTATSSTAVSSGREPPLIGRLVRPEQPPPEAG